VRVSQSWRLWALTLPLLAIVLSPVLYLVAATLFQNGSFSLSPLRDAVLSSRQLVLLVRSCFVAGGASAIAVLVGVPFAFVCSRTDTPLGGLLRRLAFIPLLIPPYVQAMAWSDLLGGRGEMAAAVQGLATTFDMRTAIGAMCVFALSYLPVVVLLAASGFASIDPSLEQAALIHARQPSVVRGVTLRLAFPHVLAAAIIVFVFSFANFEVPDILRLRVFPMEVFISFAAYYDTAKATVLSAPMVVVCVALLAALGVFTRGRSHALLTFSDRQQLMFRTGFWRWPLLGFAAAVVVTGVGVPVVVLIWRAGGPDVYLKVIRTCSGALWYTLWSSAVAGALAVVLSLPVAYLLTRRRGATSGLLDFASQLPFGIPSVALGIGLIGVWNRPGMDWVYGGSFMLVLGLVAAYAAFVVRVLAPSIGRLDVTLEEAGWVAGAGWWSTSLHVLLPNLVPGALAAFGIAFALSLANLGTALLVVAPGRSTLPVTVYNYLHYGSKDSVHALCVLLLMAVAPVYALLELARRAALRRRVA
jgi:iron(III) transport system permease protein